MSPVAAPVCGLILAGGASSRMHRDKAALRYGGKTQLDRAFDLASRHLARVFVSVRASQAGEPTRSDKPLIVDSVGSEAGGPIVGIRSAMAAYPDVAWLVIACDLPFLSDAALEQLLRARDPSVLATAFVSAHDGLPEPLCAIWEPAAAAALSEYQAGGGRCPRKFLRRYPASLIEPHDRHALDNVNTPDEYTAAQLKLETHVGAAPMQLKIQYFALMREQTGRSDEMLETTAATPADLFAELTARYGFTLSREQLKVAVNTEFSDWSRRLNSGDAVVFIPPVAGG
ncbi:MAG TPA: NTP transferase domain-containing protein [Steroidobacteraceae bacterium]|nr:NTP transferase domain-containing protein [Steroidobacteraceae bacterium]